MSGTSLDGVDLAHIQFKYQNHWSFEIHENETIPYDHFWLNELKNAIDYSDEKLNNLNLSYTKLLAEIINSFIHKNKIKNLDAICSHGHTIKHQPKEGFTLQIGNLPELANYLNQNVVCDFRVQDVELGGHGAPLVPIGDTLLFSEFDYCLNLGGFSNISFEHQGKRIAFDISPVNTVLNYFANQLNLPFDDKGTIASSGNIIVNLFDELNAIPFYNSQFPKSLGMEFVNAIILPILSKYPEDLKDKMRTFTEHIALQIGKQLTKKNASLLISGGGAYNSFLVERIQFYAPNTKITIPNSKILEYKEALIFGLLGVLRLRNEINVLASVTGASNNHSSGKIFWTPQ